MAIIKQNAVCILVHLSWPFVTDLENKAVRAMYFWRAEDECTDLTWFVLR